MAFGGEIGRLHYTIGVDNNEAVQGIDETSHHGENAQSKLTSAFKKIGTAVATYFAVDKIKNFGIEIVNTAAEVGAEVSAFDQIMGDYAGKASEKVGKIAEATGMVDSRLTPYMTSMTAKFKGLGYDVEDATNYASRGLNLAADAAAFWDKSLDESMRHLNSFINGSYEGGEAIGLFANDTQMASYAVRQGIVSETKEWTNLDEARKQATRLEYAENMMTASGATGQAAKEAGQYANVQANLTEKWRQFKAEIGEPLLQDVVIPAMDKLSGLVDTLSVKFQDLKQWVSENEGTLNNVATAIQTVAEIALYATSVFVAFKAAMFIQKVVQGFQSAQVAISLLSMEIGGANLAQAALNGTMAFGETIVALLTGKMTLAALAQGAMTKAQAALNAVMNANPIGIIITVIAALVAAFTYLWNHCEGFREFWINLWEELHDKVGEIGSKIADKFGDMKAKVGEHFDKMKENIGKAMTAAKDTVNEKLSNIKSAYEKHGGGIKGTVAAMMEAVKGYWSSGFTFIDKLSGGKLSDLVTKFKDKFGNIQNKVKEVIDKIKGFFSNLTLKLPNIKLPHFKISGSFSLSPPSVPKLSIDWYKKAMNDAMILNSPTIFGINPAGQLMGAGEAGSEVVSGTDTLLRMIRDSVRAETNSSFEKLISVLSNYFPQIIDGMNRDVVLYPDTLVGKLAPAMDGRLGDISRLRNRGQ